MSGEPCAAYFPLNFYKGVPHIIRTCSDLLTNNVFPNASIDKKYTFYSFVHF